MTQVIVGVDESEGAAEALRWAVHEGAGRDWTVRAVLAWDYLDQHQPDVPGSFDPGYDAEAAAKDLAAIVDRAVGPEAAASIELEAVCDLPASALVDRSADADLLVVGSRGLGGFKSLLVGSVSDECLRHAHCPVALVRPGAGPVGHLIEQIAVGVDGSDNALTALHWAFDLARTCHAEVTIVHTWQPIVTGGPFTPVVLDPWDDGVDQKIDEAIESVDTTGLHITRITTGGSAVTAILEAAQGADLVVVGSRGLGGFASLLLGSVSQQVAHHAPCPVVVVPLEDSRTR
jgi:nucleotide-binding universal stress UspA family protein